jgi:sugar diacid utilization regulator
MRHKEYKKGIFLVILSICFYQNDILNFSAKSLLIVFSTLHYRLQHPLMQCLLIVFSTLH